MNEDADEASALLIITQLPFWTPPPPLCYQPPTVSKLPFQIPPATEQFIKYLFCGGTTFIVHNAIVYALGATINPALSDSLGDELRFTRSAQNHSIAFFISNAVAYFLNVRFVFQSGRFKKRTEVALFFLAAGLSFFPALFSLNVVIRTFSLNSHFANIAFAVTAAVANFFVRKFLIFRKE